MIVASSSLGLSFGAHVFLWAADGSAAEYDRAIEAASRHGVDFLQVSLSPRGLDLPAVKESLEKHGLKCLTGLAVPGAVWDDRRRGALRRYLTDAVDATAALGATILSGALYTPMDERPEPGRRSDELRHLRADLKEAAQHAAALGVRLGLEPLNRYETSLVNTCEQMLELIAEVDEANVFVHLDTFHMNIEERSLRGAIVTAGDQLGYIQLAESDRGVPGEGLICWDEVFAGLRDIAYEGPIAFESFSARNTVLARAACLWRDVVGDPDVFVESGRANMRASAKRVGFDFPG
jgi:D-psicose/D-tagatose/L-ribulose 3-epimerase